MALLTGKLPSDDGMYEWRPTRTPLLEPPAVDSDAWDDYAPPPPKPRPSAWLAGEGVEGARTSPPSSTRAPTHTSRPRSRRSSRTPTSPSRALSARMCARRTGAGGRRRQGPTRRAERSTSLRPGRRAKRQRGGALARARTGQPPPSYWGQVRARAEVLRRRHDVVGHRTSGALLLARGRSYVYRVCRARHGRPVAGVSAQEISTVMSVSLTSLYIFIIEV